MAIAQFLAQILAAQYGRDVRQTIHDAIEECYDDVSTAKTLATNATNSANTAAALANEKATLANEKATLANTKAVLAGDAATGANAAAQEANEGASQVAQAIADARALADSLTGGVVGWAEDAINALVSEAEAAITAAEEITEDATEAATYAENMAALANAILVEKSLINPKGPYQGGDTYKILDLVSKDGTSYLYINLQEASGIPLNDTDHWMVFAEKGEGSGADGLAVIDGKLYLTADGVIISNGVTMPAGGGGGGSSGSITLTNLMESNIITIAKGAPVSVDFGYSSSEAPGNGTARIYVNEILKATAAIITGANTIDLTQHVGGGANTVRLYCYDMFGNYKNIVYTINAVDLRITSSFDDSVFQTGDIEYRCIPYGAVEKTIHYLLDGVEIMTHVTSETGKQLTKTLPAFSHGVHRLDVYATAEVAEGEIQSAVLSYEIISIESGNNTPLIGSSYFKTTAKQGDLIEIPFVAYLFSDMTPDVTLTIESEGDVISTQTRTVSRTKQFWRTRNYPAGTVTFTITLGAASKMHTIEVEEVLIPVSPISNDMVAHLSAAGRANGQAGYDTWEDQGVAATFTGFNWVDNGWVDDENGDSVLRVSGPAVATINYKPFAVDAKSTGLTIEVEYKIRDVNNRDAVPFSCQSGGIGFALTSDTGSLRSQQSSIFCNYKDEEKTRISFVIEPGTGAFRMMSMYLNGVLSSIKQYPSTDTFQQASPVNITIGSELCGIDIYRIRIYSTALTMEGIKDNFVADTIDVGLRAQRYVDNYSIYDEYGNISFSSLRDKMPVMVIVGTLPSYKGDKKTVKVVYTDPQNPSLNFEDDKVQIDVQGTSSQFYVRKNWKIKFPSGVYRQHIPGAIASRVFCMKADYADSTSTHNTQTANYVHELYDNPTPPQELYDGVRRSVQGFPCVIFHRVDETSDYEFHGKYNFNYDKDSLEAYGFTSEFPLAESWEFLNNPSAQCEFQEQISLTDTYFDTEENEERFIWQNNFEARQPSDYTDISKFKIMHDWVVSTWQGGATNANLPASYTGLDNTVYTKDSAAYRLAKFKKEFEDHFDMSASVTYYLFTLVMLMTDQRAKNMFLTTWDGVIWEPWFYDNDTILGINNEGLLVFDYFHEDIDQVGGGNVFNGQISTLWTNFREAFPNEIRALYNTWRTDGRLNYEKIIDYYINHGSDKWSEAIYNEDSEFKYVALLKENNDASQLYQVRGTGEEHLRYFASNRLRYMDSKFFGVDYSSRAIGLRLYTPAVGAATRNAVAPTTNVTITPYSNMYVGIRYGLNGPLYTARGVENTPVTISGYSGTPNNLETSIYGASEIASLGNIAGLYAGTINVAAATKLKELIAGSSNSNYNNDQLISLSLGNNKLLSKLDVRGCTNLVNPIDLSGCPNIKEVYADRTKITGVAFGDSGYLTTLSLPNTITNLTLKNQNSISSFTCAGYSNLTSLVLENVTGVPLATILSNAANLARVRLTGVNLTYSNTTSLDQLAAKGGIDENGNNTPVSVITGVITISATVYTDQIAAYSALWPELTINYTSLQTRYIVVFKNWDGTVLKTEPVLLYGNASAPTATKAAEEFYTFTFAGWTVPFTNVQNDITTVAKFTPVPKPMLVRFLNGATVLQSGNFNYGTYATYNSYPQIPTKTNGAGEDWKFSGWAPDPDATPVTGPVDFIAQFTDWNDPEAVITEIGPYQFYNNTTVAFTSLPETVTRIGLYAFYGCTNLALTSLPSELTSIGSYAFRNCSNLALTSLPSGLTSIGEHTFYGCTKLALTSLPSGVTSIGNYTFYGCTKLALTSLPSGVTSIEGAAFFNCAALALTSLPSGITSIGSNAFGGCANLALTSLPSGITYIWGSAFDGCTKLALTSLPSGITYIGDYTFYGCTNLALTSLPSGLTAISDSAFRGCTNLALTSLPSGITSIGDYTFHSCSSLALTSLPSGITRIGNGTLNGCTSLALTSLPSGLRSIGTEAFRNCTSLALTSLPSGTTSIASSAFYNCADLALTSLPSGLTSIASSAFNGCTNLALTSIPSGLTSIGDNAFYGCTNLALTSLPSGIMSIGYYVFQNCTNLALTSLPSGLTSIGDNAFDSCANLALTSLPSGLTNIASYAFRSCTNLALTSLPSGLTSIGTNAFYGCSNLALTSLPSGMTYIGANAFRNCTNLAFTSLPSGIMSIGYYVFQNCTNLALTSLPSGLTIISGNAFYGCSNLALTSLPSGLTGIGANAFQNCTNLSTIRFMGTPASIGSDSFAGCTNLITINAPWSSGAVANSPWGATNATINYNYVA